MLSHEHITTHPNIQLPSLEGLTDAEYLAKSREFGKAWQAYVEGEQEDMKGMESVSEILAKRSAALAAIPEENRAPTLIASYRTAANEQLTAHGQEPLQVEPLTPELLAAAGVQVVETRPGVPAILTNGRHNDALFGTRSTNFAAGVLNNTEDSLPFVVLQDTRDSHPDWFDLNRRHETAHTIWGVARQEMTSTEPTTNEQMAFLHAQDEGIAFATAGQRQFLHAGNVQELTGAGMEDSAQQYREIDTVYRETTTAVEPSAAVLGLMQSHNADELQANMDRLHSTAEHLKPPAPPDRTAATIGTSALGGWGAA